ncbi:hypothetical protein ES703_116725 [subsurface metagenome]
MFFAVSSNVSPLRTLEVDAERLIESADSLFSAREKELRVRVLGSKKRFATVIPRRVGAIFMGRFRISSMDSATFRISSISSIVSSSIPKRSFLFIVFDNLYYLD